MLRVPGIDAATVANALGNIWPDATRRSEVTIAGKAALRFDTPDNPDISPTTNFAVPRGDALFLFEDTDQTAVSKVMAQIP